MRFLTHWGIYFPHTCRQKKRQQGKDVANLLKQIVVKERAKVKARVKGVEKERNERSF